MNTAAFTGRLCEDPELRKTNSGKDVCNFRFAVQRDFDKDTADFFSVTAWGKTAEFCAKYLGKGRLAAISGRVQNGSYTSRDGQERHYTEIVADRVQGLDWPKDESQQEAQVEPGEDYDPFAPEEA